MQCLVVVHVVGIKAMGIVIIGIGEVVGIAMNAKEGDQNGRVLLDGVVGTRHGEVLSDWRFRKGRPGYLRMVSVPKEIKDIYFTYFNLEESARHYPKHTTPET